MRVNMLQAKETLVEIPIQFLSKRESNRTPCHTIYSTGAMAATSGCTKHLSNSQQQQPPYPVLPPDGALYSSNQSAPYPSQPASYPSQSASYPVPGQSA